MPTNFTDPAELMKLMMAETKPIELANWADFVALYAARLSEVAPKLTEEEVWRFIAIGAAMYQRGFREFEAGLMGGELMDYLRRVAKDDKPPSP